MQFDDKYVYERNKATVACEHCLMNIPNDCYAHLGHIIHESEVYSQFSWLFVIVR